MCYPASYETAKAFAFEVSTRFPDEVKSAQALRTGRENPWFPAADVEVHVVARGNPEELRPKIADLVREYMWRDDVWVEVRVLEADATSAEPPMKATLVDA